MTTCSLDEWSLVTSSDSILFGSCCESSWFTCAVMNPCWDLFVFTWGMKCDYLWEAFRFIVVCDKRWYQVISTKSSRVCHLSPCECCLKLKRLEANVVWIHSSFVANPNCPTYLAAEWWSRLLKLWKRKTCLRSHVYQWNIQSFNDGTRTLCG